MLMVAQQQQQPSSSNIIYNSWLTNWLANVSNGGYDSNGTIGENITQSDHKSQLASNEQISFEIKTPGMLNWKQNASSENSFLSSSLSFNRHQINHSELSLDSFS